MEFNFETNKKVEPFYALRAYHRNHTPHTRDILYGMQEADDHEAPKRMNLKLFDGGSS